MDWIKVTDRKPGGTGDYIVANKSGVFSATYVAPLRSWFGKFGEIKTPITHWMPFPDFPKNRLEDRDE